MSKKTPWFPPDVKPVHVGFYESKQGWYNVIVMRYWDGRTWWARGKFVKFKCGIQNRYWRGLAEKPKGE